jgi:hypothetical protein
VADACPHCSALHASLEREKAEKERLSALVADWREMADGVSRQELASREARAYRDAKELTLRWAADQLSALIRSKDGNSEA